jgi:hypothetical protein
MKVPKDKQHTHTHTYLYNILWFVDCALATRTA